MGRELDDSTIEDVSNEESKNSLEAKKARADKIIAMHVAGAVTVGFTPIPFSDAPILIANQIALVNNVANVYERAELKELMSVLLKQIGVGLIVSRLAVSCTAYLTAQLLKIFPILGSIAGGLVNGSVAGAVTYGYGVAANTFCYLKCRDAASKGWESNMTDDDIRNFTHTFNQAFDGYPAELARDTANELE